MFYLRPFSEGRTAPNRNALTLLMACILMAGGAATSIARKASVHISTVAQSDESYLKAQAEGEGNQLTVKAEGDAVIVDVSSRSGIGRASMKLVSGTIPKKIVLRLRVKGLEEFRLSRDGSEIIARVSSGDGGVTQSIRSRDGDERPITSANPRWLDVKIVSERAAPHIPLEQGHFEITLPKDFLREGGRSFSIRWIDFYR
jgi:hypothetical protein